MREKKCSKCGEVKPLTSEFYYKDNRSTSGFRSPCKVCVNKIRKHYNHDTERIKERKKQYYQDNKERRNEHSKQYYQDNKERKKQYYQDNKERIQERKKQYYQDNKERIQEYNQDNKERIQERKKQHYQDNKEQRKQYTQDNKERIQELANERYKNDHQYRLKCNIRSRLRSAVRKFDLKKSKKTLDYLGCTIQELMEHLQKTAIDNGYTDFNIYDYDGEEYHIDHIKPFKAVHDGVSTLDEVCHYSNLQILLADTNRIKSGKY